MVAEIAVWAALCFGIWLLSLSAVSDAELAIGAASSVACGVAAMAVRRAIGLHWSVRAVPWAALPTMVLAIGSDAVQVLIRPLRRAGAGNVEVLDTGARGQGAAAVTRRAVATMVMSASPGTVVLDADDRGRVTFHTLGYRGPRSEDKVSRP